MKNITLILLALGFSFGLNAQTKAHKPVDSEAREERKQLRQAELIQELNLTEEQQLQWEEIRKKHKEEREQERKETREKMRERQQSKQAEFEAVLTPDQIEKLQELRERRQEDLRERRREGRREGPKKNRRTR